MKKIIILSLILLFLISCTGRIYCREEQRNADVCIALYEPVCGNDGKTYSNSCSACKEENIKYFIKREC